MTGPDRNSSHDGGALAGWNVVVTRPRNSAAPLIRALRSHGACVLRLPAQQVQVNSEFDWATALATHEDIDDWIFTSPSAVSHAFALLERELPNGCVFAVGSSTAAALSRHGVAAIAPDQSHTSEALLDLGRLRDVAGRRIAIVTAPGGRGLIAVTLRERGAEVVEWQVYCRRTVVWSQRKMDALAALDGSLLTLISSAETLDIIASSLPANLWQRLRDARWIASSERIEACLRQRGATRIDLAASALPSDLLVAALAVR
ncbi:MAG: uroporphyrinogen-III synthase [Dokdonella sp.]